MVRFVAPATAAVAAALLAVPPGAAETDDRPGRVVRIEKVVSEMVKVSGGPVRLGASIDQLATVHDACSQMYAPELHDYFCEHNRRIPAVSIEGQWTMLQGNARTVSLRSFAIDRHEVTTKQFRRCVEAGGCSATPLLAGDESRLRPELPVVNVTWQDAVDYCRWRGKRLPTEDEWEKAARGTDGRRWPWGDQERIDGANVGKVEDPSLARMRQAANNGQLPWPVLVADTADGFQGAAPPGSMVWGLSPSGVHDMAGNVREWVADYYTPHIVKPPPILDRRLRGNQTVLPNRYRSVRGGSWAMPRVVARTYFRQYLDPKDRAADLGFRCARDL